MYIVVNKMPARGHDNQQSVWVPFGVTSVGHTTWPVFRFCFFFFFPFKVRRIKHVGPFNTDNVSKKKKVYPSQREKSRFEAKS